MVLAKHLTSDNTDLNRAALQLPNFIEGVIAHGVA